MFLTSYSQVNRLTCYQIINRITPIIKFVNTPSKDGIYLNIAVLLPLTGKYSKIGQSVKNSLVLGYYALKMHYIKIHFHDIGSNNKAVKNQIEKFNFKNIDFILGPIFIEQIEMIYLLSQKHNVFMISYSNDKRLLDKKGLFVLSISVEEQISHIVSYALCQRYSSIYVILPNNNNHKNIVNFLKKKYILLVKNILLYKQKNDQIPKLSNLIMNIKKSINLDIRKSAILIVEDKNNIIEPLKYIQFLHSDHDIQYKILRIGNWSNKRINTNVSLDSWISDIPYQSIFCFNKKFAAVYQKPTSRIGAIAYDSLLLLRAITHNINDILIIDFRQLLSIDGYKGITGIFKFTHHGNAERIFFVYELDKFNKFKVISKIKEFF